MASSHADVFCCICAGCDECVWYFCLHLRTMEVNGNLYVVPKAQKMTFKRFSTNASLQKHCAWARCIIHRLCVWALHSALMTVQFTEFEGLLSLDIYTKSHLSDYHPQTLLKLNHALVLIMRRASSLEILHFRKVHEANVTTCLTWLTFTDVKYLATGVMSFLFWKLNLNFKKKQTYLNQWTHCTYSRAKQRE